MLKDQGRTDCPYFDPLGERGDFIYSLTVYKPTAEQVPSRFYQWCNRKSPEKTWDRMLVESDLKTMDLKVVKVKAEQFPLDFRYMHVTKGEKKCPNVTDIGGVARKQWIRRGNGVLGKRERS